MILVPFRGGLPLAIGDGTIVPVFTHELLLHIRPDVEGCSVRRVGPEFFEAVITAGGRIAVNPIDTAKYTVWSELSHAAE